ncbi:MAG: glycosyl hydrolase, partial [Gemmatimonadales bacterium]
GRNPPGGAVVYFALKSVPDSTQPLSLEFLDSAGTLIRSFSTRRVRGADSLITTRIVRDSLKVGMNRVIWNMRYPDAVSFQNLIMWAGGVAGPLAPPGRYQVRLTTGGHSQTREFRYVSDPRVHTSAEDYARQFQLLIRIRDRLGDANRAVVQIRDLRAQLDQVTTRLAGVAGAPGIRAKADSLKGRLTEVEEQVYQTKNRSSQDPLNYPIRLNNRIAALAGVVALGDARPTDQAYQVFDQISTELQVQLDRLRQIVETDVPAFNAMVREANVPALIVR